MWEALSRFGRWWDERLYWRGYLLFTILLTLGYVSVAYFVIQRVDFLVVLYFTLVFPANIVMHHARRSPVAGRSVYLTLGAVLGALATSLSVFLAAFLLRAAVGATIPAPTLVLGLALGAVWGALVGNRVGRRRGYLVPAA